MPPFFVHIGDIIDGVDAIQTSRSNQCIASPNLTQVPAQSTSRDPDHAPLHRAATVVWCLGVVEIIAFGGMAACLGWAAVLTPHRLEHLAGQSRLTQPQIDRLLEAQPTLGAWAVALIVFGALPGVLYLFLGSGVRTGRQPPTMVALTLAATQVLVFGVSFIARAAQAFLAHQPVAFTINALTLGSLLVLLGFALYGLWTVWTDIRKSDPS